MFFVGAPAAMAALTQLPDDIRLDIWWWLIVLGLAVTPIALAWVIFGKFKRPKPDGYVGRYRRADGSEVHVARVNGRLMVASGDQPPRDLGDVSGRDLLRWERLATTPDG